MGLLGGRTPPWATNFGFAPTYALPALSCSASNQPSCARDVPSLPVRQPLGDEHTGLRKPRLRGHLGNCLTRRHLRPSLAKSYGYGSLLRAAPVYMSSLTTVQNSTQIVLCVLLFLVRASVNATCSTHPCRGWLAHLKDLGLWIQLLAGCSQ